VWQFLWGGGRVVEFPEQNVDLHWAISAVTLYISSSLVLLLNQSRTDSRELPRHSFPITV
jgi:hypothetical protein